MSRRQFCGALGAALPAVAANPARKPNVIFLLTDDQGYGDLSCLGNPLIHTPHMDRLHSESVRFTDFHVEPLCAPTRSSLMTGRYCSRTGIWATIFGRSLLRTDEVTMADMFAANGYRTSISGKWHLGDNYPYRPRDRGFHDVLVHGGGGVGQTPDYWGNSYYNDTYFRNGTPEKFAGYCTDIWFQNTMRFIEENRNRPFFAYLPVNAPHLPRNVDEKYYKPYLDKGVPEQTARYYGMIENIDENLGRLRAHLQRLGLEQNTVLMFMSDNGAATGAPTGEGATFKPFTAGMRAEKGSPYEGGHRVPFFLHWPGGGIQGGRDVTALSAHVDVLPTLIDLLGLKRTPGPEFDGVSLAPLIRGKAETKDRSLVIQVQQRDTPVKWARSVVLARRWRLVEGKELFDLRSDPGQKQDLAAKHPDVTARLRDDYERWWSSVSSRYGEYCNIPLGSDRAKAVRLDCMDWHSEQMVPWDQTDIRRAMVCNGFWAVDVKRAGRYEFALREQPVEARFPMQAREARLRIGALDESKPVPPGATSVKFPVTLPAGATRLETRMTGFPDAKERGAYYVDVAAV